VASSPTLPRAIVVHLGRLRQFETDVESIPETGEEPDYLPAAPPRSPVISRFRVISPVSAVLRSRLV
jgi:hypothetical protein